MADEIGEEQYYLFGAHQDDYLSGPPGKIIAKRHGATCRANGRRRHLGSKGSSGPSRPSLKSARQQFLAAELGHVLGAPPSSHTEHRRGRTSRVHSARKNRKKLGYLYFEFYNGAIEHRAVPPSPGGLRVGGRQRPTKAIALMGGDDPWSNGIDLTVIEAAPDPARESWRNINAMDDLVRRTSSPPAPTSPAPPWPVMPAPAAPSSRRAADLVFSRRRRRARPPLSDDAPFDGSEYWTYLLPRRV